MNLRPLLTSDVVTDEKRQILSGGLDIFHFIEDISRKHARLLGRGILKHLDGGNNSRIDILADLNADSAVGSGSFFIQARVFVLIISFTQKFSDSRADFSQLVK